MRIGRRSGPAAPLKMGQRVSAFFRRKAKRNLGLVGIYIIEPVFDRRVMYGNHTLHRVLVGTTTSPSRTKAKAKQYGLGFDNQMWVWWVQGKANADAVMKRLGAALDPHDDDPALGSWFSHDIEGAKKTIAITAHVAGVKCMTPAQAKKLEDEEALRLVPRVLKGGRS